MKTFKVTFVEETTNEVCVEALTKKDADNKVNSGNFSDDVVIERDHFQITKTEEWKWKRLNLYLTLMK